MASVSNKMKYTNKKSKKGISPVVATVLLVVMVIIIALIIFFWLKSLQKEAITKFGGTNIELVCQDVSFSANYDNYLGSLALSNLGNIPIYSFNLKISKTSGHETKEIKELDSAWSKKGLRKGEVFNTVSLSSEFSDATKIEVIPILLGKTTSSKEKAYVCPEQYGQEISLT